MPPQHPPTKSGLDDASLMRNLKKNINVKRPDYAPSPDPARDTPKSVRHENSANRLGEQVSQSSIQQQFSNALLPSGGNTSRPGSFHPLGNNNMNSSFRPSGSSVMRPSTNPEDAVHYSDLGNVAEDFHSFILSFHDFRLDIIGRLTGLDDKVTEIQSAQNEMAKTQDELSENQVDMKSMLAQTQDEVEKVKTGVDEVQGGVQTTMIQMESSLRAQLQKHTIVSSNITSPVMSPGVGIMRHSHNSIGSSLEASAPSRQSVGFRINVPGSASLPMPATGNHMNINMKALGGNRTLDMNRFVGQEAAMSVPRSPSGRAASPMPAGAVAPMGLKKNLENISGM